MCSAQERESSSCTAASQAGHAQGRAPAPAPAHPWPRLAPGEHEAAEGHEHRPRIPAPDPAALVREPCERARELLVGASFMRPSPCGPLPGAALLLVLPAPAARAGRGPGGDARLDGARASRRTRARRSTASSRLRERSRCRAGLDEQSPSLVRPRGKVLEQERPAPLAERPAGAARRSAAGPCSPPCSRSGRPAPRAHRGDLDLAPRNREPGLTRIPGSTSAARVLVPQHAEGDRCRSRAVG
jgi:hypothetical protein